MKNIISTSNAPAAIGPYSQAVEINGILFVSGQIPVNPKTGEVVNSSIEEATNQIFQNIGEILKTAGYTFADVVKTTVFLTDINNFAAMNGVYAQYFTEKQPARSAVAVNALPKNVPLEIEVIAAK